MNRFAFLSEQTDRRRVPVALLSGFLGSGKTTLVNALLTDSRMAGTAVAVNEFGEIPLDRDLIDHGADKTVVMANGCLCCNLAGDMEDAVMRLFSRREGGQVPRFDRLLIEPSGLADPAPIVQAILRNPVMSRVFRLDCIVTTVDALFAASQLARHPETRKQVALADRLVLTKPDLVPAEAIDRLRADLRDHNPAAPILVASHGAIDAASLFPAVFFDPASAAAAPSRSGLFGERVDPDHAARHQSVSLVAGGKLHWRRFDEWLRGIRLTHADQLLRVKAMLAIDGVDGPVVVQGVHHVMDAPVELEAWPAGERLSRLVLIGDHATIAAARESWAEALPGMAATNQEESPCAP
ncbi:MAG TPA: GTP-binding protein [Rhodopila sp.]|nr:GTP-binding protein [Rhodopila sp.]